MARFLSIRLALFVVTVMAISTLGYAQSTDDKPADVFKAFFAKPDKENYLRALKATTDLKSYNPYSTDLSDVSELIDDGKFDDARKKLKACMPEFMLSPRAHQFSAKVKKQLGDAKAAKRETELAKKCIDGILSTGDGTADKPYSVTRVSDEYDLLAHLGKRMVSQGLAHKNGKSCDRLQCGDGSELWFDVSPLFAALMK